MEVKANFYIKYKSIDEVPLDLASLGESLIGFEELSKNLILKVAQANGDIKIKAIKAHEGSIIFDTEIIISSVSLFLHSKHVFDFFQVLGGETWRNFMVLHQRINGLANEYPVDYDFAKWLVITIAFAKYQKRALTAKYNNREMPIEPTTRLYNLTKRRKFKKVLTPFVDPDSGVESIEFSSDPNFKESVEINRENFGEYLTEDQIILSELNDGDVVQLTGSIVALQASRGDSMRFRLLGADPKYRDLTAYPAEGKGTEEYRQFYKTKNIIITAKISRASMYQKPLLYIMDIKIAQKDLPDLI